MYLSNDNRLPKPPGTPGGNTTRWRLHFEYALESEDDANQHAETCRTRKLPVKTDGDGRPVQRRLTVAVLNLSDDKRKELARFSASTACSWVDSFDKETGRREALVRLATRLKAGGKSWPTKQDGNTLARGLRYTYEHRPRYKGLPEALQLLRRVVGETEHGDTVTMEEIRTFLKQFN